MDNDNQEIIFYCTYCKNPIYSTDTYVVHDGKHYHRKCFKLIVTETEFLDEE